MAILKKIKAFIINNWELILLVPLLGVYAYFLFYHLGNRAFIEWDESIYAQVAKEAFLKHSYLSFTFWGKLWFEKPPLLIWFTVLGFKIFGINELGGRFFVAVFAFLTIILTLLLAKKISRSNGAMLLTAACFGICYQFFFHSFFLEFDIPETFFVLLSIYALLLALEDARYFYLFFAAIGMGVLAKSVIGLMPLPIAAIYLLFSKQLYKLKSRHFVWGIGAAIIIILPWHIWETIKFGKNFWDSYLIYHAINRYLQPLENNGGPWNFYTPVLWQNTIFEFLLAGSSLYFFYQTFKKKFNYFLLLLAAAFIFLFFSAAQTKGFGYIVIMYPFVLIMFGITLNDFLQLTSSKWLKCIATIILTLVFVALGWQESNFKILKLENSADSLSYQENKTIAQFILKYYPNKQVYGASWVESNLAFDYYLGRQVQNLPAQLVPPSNFSEHPNNRVYHQIKRSVYNFPDYLYIAP